MATAKKAAATKLSADTKKKLLRLCDRLDKKATKAVLNNGFAKVQKIGTVTEKIYQRNPDGAWGGKWVPKKYDRVVLLDEGFCGSTACVLGHAAMIPEFTRKGLYVEVTDIQKIKDKRLADGYNFYGGEGDDVFKDPKNPRKKIKNGFDAGMKFFGLCESHAVMMFGGELTRAFYGSDDNTKNITPKRVAKYLRKYVETNGQWGEDVLAYAGVNSLEIMR